MKYGNELREQIEAKKQRVYDIIDRREERIANCEYDWDDCFVSSHIDADQIRECNMQLEILKGDGTMPVEAVFDENGKEVNVRWVHTRYGGAYVGRGIFASSKQALCKRRVGRSRKSTCLVGRSSSQAERVWQEFVADIRK